MSIKESKFILESLEDLNEQVKLLPDSTESRSIKVIIRVLIDLQTRSDDDADAHTQLLDSIESDMQEIKNKTSTLKDYRFWGVVTAVLGFFCTLIWGSISLKLQDEFKNTFVEKRFEKIIEQHVEMYNIYTLTDAPIIKDSKKHIEKLKEDIDIFKKEVDSHRTNDELIHNQMWQTIKSGIK